MTLLEEVSRSAPRSAPARYLLGVAQMRQGRCDQAIENLQAALQADGNHADCRAVLGEALWATRPAEAIPHLRKATELAPTAPDAYCSLSAAFAQLRKYEDALVACDSGLKNCGAEPRLLGNRAAALHGMGRYEEALDSLQQQAALLPADEQPWVHRGIVLAAMGRMAEAKACFLRACQLTPDDPEAHYGLALTLLRSGEYRDGFREHEWRWGTRGQKKHRLNLAQPLWDGKPLQGQRLLVYAEQGHGDTIQFLRYGAEAKRRAPDLIVTVHSNMVRLASWLAEPLQIVSASEPLPHFDVQCPMLTLPHLFGTDEALIPPPAAFVIPAAMQHLWRTRLEGAPGLKVGLVWAGSPDHMNDQNRSLPVDLLAPLAEIGNVRYFSLQVGPAAGSLAGSRLAPCVKDISADLTDYGETAAAISQLDLVIAVDTSVAHLAGSLGTPTWLLVPFAPDWRWLLDRDDSPWYPSMRLFRQKRPGAWEEVIERITQELSVRAQSSEAPATAVHLSKETDIRRWSNSANLEAAWNERARLAGDFIPSGATVLDLGCGAMALEGYLPFGCQYLPCDVVRRDPRTVLCDFNEQPIPPAPGATHITCLGVLEYLRDVPAFLRQLRTFQKPVVLSYCPTEFTAHLDRKGLGWVNHLSLRDLAGELGAAGFFLQSSLRADHNQVLIRAVPNETRLRKKSRVLVLSYNNAGNFGDRLGFHLINSVLPAHTEVHFAHFHPWDVPAGDFDLLVLGIGNSIFQPLLTDELLTLVRKVPRSVGIFGTQYRDSVDRGRMSALLDALSVWFARYEEDLLLYGRGRANAIHLGDWLISAFPMAQWKRDETLHVGAEIWNDLPLDRTIQRVQEYRNVVSQRLHPLLCALTSAERVAYAEQREDGSGQNSGKFRSLLVDIFGRTWPESSVFTFDREQVAAYRAKVLRVMAAMPSFFAGVLEAGLPEHASNPAAAPVKV